MNKPTHPTANPPAAACKLQPAWALAMLLSLPLPALADGGRMMPSTVPKAYTAECAACHTAYPPGMLPADSWRRIMGGLDKHYGTNATLDGPTLAQITTWLQANAGTHKRVSSTPPEDRITRSAWFERKHREVNPAVWRHASVKTAANCAACHTGADQGRFDDDNLRIPPGLEPRLARGWRD